MARAAQQADGTYDFRPLFEPVAPIVSAADVAICHMETPIAEDDQDISGYPVFSAPRRVADGIAAAGFDGCSTASNHSLDRGLPGIASTLAAFDAVGLKHAGTGRSEPEAEAPAVYVADGVRIANLSYAYGSNLGPLPGAAPWSMNLIDPGRVISDARAARRRGAAVVVASLHWGVEYHPDATSSQEVVAKSVMASGAVDLIVGHHAHVPQGIRKVAGRWVVFGLGNFVSNQSPTCCAPASQDGVMVRVDLAVSPGSPADIEGVVYTPLRVDRAGGYRVVPVGEALRDPGLAGALDPNELRSSYVRTVAVVAAAPDPLLRTSATPP